MAPGRVFGRVALVTGAGSSLGIGFAIASALAREGATICVSDIDHLEASNRTKELNMFATARAFAHDVTSEDHWAAIIDQVMSTYGRLDILINNAGIAMPWAALADLSHNQWQRVIDVNLTGVFLGCKFGVQAMRRCGGGSIVNVSSIAGLMAIRGTGAYGAAKAGVTMLTKIVALDEAHAAIRCNAIHPGLIGTSMLQGLDTESKRKMTAEIPLKRIGRPIDVANCALFLASDEASYVTGASYTVDGGMSGR